MENKGVLPPLMFILLQIPHNFALRPHTHLALMNGKVLKRDTNRMYPDSIQKKKKSEILKQNNRWMLYG